MRSTEKQMQAARYHRYGGPEVLVVEDAPEPHAEANTVRIEVGAASINPIDYLLRSGRLSDVVPLDLPAIPGRDAAGVVDEVGPGVVGTQVGDVVFGVGGISDTTAQYAVLTAWSSAPSDWSIEHAAAAGLASSTASAVIEALEVFGILEGKTVLIDGASGAVGTALSVLARDSGAEVIGTGSPRNHDYLIGLGVRPTTYGPGLAERVALLAPGGVDAAVHTAPSSLPADLITLVGDPARVVTVLDAEGAERLGARKIDARNESQLLERASKLGRRGIYLPRVDHILPFAQIADAHAVAERGSGKVVVTMR
ncbi:NADP-dependent oxidoreductase [Rhodococcus cercidiphylli]|uniref:NADP-dependent oxidoreductase n=2 Tax=Rhodococcus cercidiphylli TaxID=489916 RepID=A0ABU4B557_9NOCA|nr:NADP-dependent oxidoreductase [Rhodococcus cercidiphylli]MDV6233640.1 NADP-dependent oxidoreductase [Rhodococcus cercidiphylli]